MSAKNVIVFVTAMLVSIGVLMVYSSSITSMPSESGETYLIRHLIAVGSSLLGMFVAASLTTDHWRRVAIPFLLLSLALLVVVLLPAMGTEVNGARRWLRFGHINYNVQPSELAKLATIVFLAWFLSKNQHRIGSIFKVFVPVLALMGVVCGLILKEPDFGTAVLITMVCLLMAYVAGVQKWCLAGTVLTAVPAAAALIMHSPYRLKRLTGFLQIWEDPLGAGYHARQSLLSLGSGGPFGLGLGRGQQKLSYLPEANTDFIFGVIGEELGLVGTLLILALFVLFLFAALRVVRRASHNSFAYLMGFGIAMQITIQAILNMAVVTAMVPTKGLPLPMISYGGSSLFINLIAVGLLLSVAREPTETVVAQTGLLEPLDMEPVA